MRRLIWLAVAAYAVPGWSWGPEGHRLVAQLAQGMLSPEAEARVRATLHPDETIASKASWADEIRRSRTETESWHFIDIPISSTGLDMKRDCPHNDCVLAKIAEFRTRWRDPSAGPEERREALLFLVHFVGDMHQPLHCADNHDKGGNEVQVEFREKAMNLHHLWDSGLLDRLPAEEGLMGDLALALTPERRAEWSRGTVEDWAAESFQAARDVVYGGLPKVAEGALPELGESYERAADPVVEQRIEKAAVRLAAILNEQP